jgi:hypothetical protein
LVLLLDGEQLWSCPLRETVLLGLEDCLGRGRVENVEFLVLLNHGYVDIMEHCSLGIPLVSVQEEGRVHVSFAEVNESMLWQISLVESLRWVVRLSHDLSVALHMLRVVDQEVLTVRSLISLVMARPWL